MCARKKNNKRNEKTREKKEYYCAESTVSVRFTNFVVGMRLLFLSSFGMCVSKEHIYVDNGRIEQTLGTNIH